MGDAAQTGCAAETNDFGKALWLSTMVEFSDLLSSPLNLLLAMGTVQKLLSALACILLKMDKDQLPSTTEGISSRSLQQIPAGSLLIASQVLPGVQKKVVTSGLLHHLSLSVSMCEVNGEKKSQVAMWTVLSNCQDTV